MRQNQPTTRVLQALRKSHPLMLSQSQLSKTYTPLRKAPTKNPNFFSANKDPFRVNTLNNTMCSRLEDTTIEEPASLIKKRQFLNELKAGLKDSSNGILRSEQHGIALYLKKSDMLMAEEVDFRTGCRIVEMEMPLARVVLRIARNYDNLAVMFDETMQKCNSLTKDNAELLTKLKHFQEITKNQPVRNQKIINTAKHIFTKFKEQQEQRSLQHHLDTNAKEDKDRDQKSKFQFEVDNLKKKNEKIENQKLKLVEALDTKLFQLKGINLSNAKLEEQNRILKESSKEKDKLIAKLQKTVQQLRQMIKFRQLWMMACQQLQQIKMIRHEEQAQTTRLNRKYRIVKQRLGNFMENKFIDIPEDCGREKEDLRMIVNSINQWSGFTKAALNQLDQGQVEKLLMDNTSKNSLQKVLIEYKQGFPSFYVFLQYHEERISYELKHINSKSISNDFFLRIRGIFDAKFNDFWYAEQWKRFPDFVIGFLEKFDICKIFKKITINLNSAQSIQNLKVNFFVDLFNPKIKEVWECDILRMFLMEQYSEDELFFFLSCRNFIFGGNMLENSISSSDPIVFITLEKAVKAVQTVLCRYDRSVIEKVKFGLQLKKKRKSSRYFIDSHFLLKILLDIYTSERQRRLQFYEATLGSLQSKNSKGQKYVNFKNFKRFMVVNYPFLSIADIASMYRQCYNLSKGQVTFNVVFAVASDKLFVKQLKQNPLLPLLRGVSVSPYAEKVIKLHDVYEDSRYFDKHLQQLGLENAIQSIQQFKKSSNFSFESELTMGKLLGAIKQSQVLTSIVIMETLRRKDSQNLEEVIEKQVLSSLKWQLEQLSIITSVSQSKQKYKTTLKNAAQKLCTIFKQKIKQIYKTFDDDINKKLVQLSK